MWVGLLRRRAPRRRRRRRRPIRQRERPGLDATLLFSFFSAGLLSPPLLSRRLLLRRRLSHLSPPPSPPLQLPFSPHSRNTLRTTLQRTMGLENETLLSSPFFYFCKLAASERKGSVCERVRLCTSPPFPHKHTHYVYYVPPSVEPGAGDRLQFFFPFSFLLRRPDLHSGQPYIGSSFCIVKEWVGIIRWSTPLTLRKERRGTCRREDDGGLFFCRRGLLLDSLLSTPLPPASKPLQGPPNPPMQEEQKPPPPPPPPPPPFSRVWSDLGLAGRRGKEPRRPRR